MEVVRQLESLRTKFRMRQTQTQLSRLNLVLPLLRLEIEFVCAPRIGWSARQMTISETEKRVLWMTPSKRAISGPSQWSNRLTSTQSRRRRVSEEKLGANWFCRDDLLCQSVPRLPYFHRPPSGPTWTVAAMVDQSTCGLDSRDCKIKGQP